MVKCFHKLRLCLELKDTSSLAELIANANKLWEVSEAEGDGARETCPANDLHQLWILFHPPSRGNFLLQETDSRGSSRQVWEYEQNIKKGTPSLRVKVDGLMSLRVSPVNSAPAILPSSKALTPQTAPFKVPSCQRSRSEAALEGLKLQRCWLSVGGENRAKDVNFNTQKSCEATSVGPARDRLHANYPGWCVMWLYQRDKRRQEIQRWRVQFLSGWTPASF